MDSTNPRLWWIQTVGLTLLLLSASSALAQLDTQVPSARDTEIAPLNFCALAPKPEGRAFQRQRVVMLDAAQDESFEGAPEVKRTKQAGKWVDTPLSVLHSVNAFAHAREVLLSVFPMKRLYLVLAKETAGREFLDKQPISLSTAQSILASDPHAAYSATCADWLVAPSISRGTAVWSQEPREKVVTDSHGTSRTVTYQAWRVSIPLTARLEVYRRDGDRFVHHASLQGKPVGRAAGQALDWTNPHDAYETVSVALPDGCPIPDAQQATAVDAFGACGGKWLDVSPLGAPTTLGGGARASHYCENVDAAVRSDNANLRALALCELRVAAEYMAADLQLHGEQMCGWKLYSPLLPLRGQGAGVSVGKYEGAVRGQYYVAYAAEEASGCGDSSDERGFGRIHHAGPGGEAGFAQPSEVHFEAGQPKLGARMEEFALHGIRIGIRPSAAVMLANGQLDSTLTAGSLIDAGYDLTRYIPFFDEVWLEAHIGLLFGAETYAPLGVGVEVARYLGNRLAAVGGAGLAITTLSKRLGVGPVDEITVSGGAVGLQARGGLSYALRPNWHLRAMLEARSGFGSTQLSNSARPAQVVDAGPVLMSTLSLSAAYTY